MGAKEHGRSHGRSSGETRGSGGGRAVPEGGARAESCREEGAQGLRLGPEIEEDKEYDMQGLLVMQQVKSSILERLLVYSI